MLQYNCRKNFYNVSRQVRNPTPYFWQKKVETYSPSKAVARNLGEELPLDRSLYNITKKKTEVSRETDGREMTTIGRSSKHDVDGSENVI